ncbi:hypothetical protein M5X17_30275 [Paenibacillus alvei]|uniref:Uncharacterized protein n=1 Tax=Paenibacillus alvei TaxID=44250 RepID=A0ABT4H7Q1_PAEAL|nr:hypothetical protein [Paenibacillus alvei]MCY9704194.1 hypothetical protein [Paenibacillus alvei]MCY9737989.1 hypothetical protein [Paenibacillus alvei]MCY9765011.1 hypothetical protein [Paenibacillus alvei]MEC0080224.1 hypothetical protein [Paenibacillus alvei]
MRYEREQAQKRRVYHPNDPDFIAPEEDEEDAEYVTQECPTCGGSGFSGHGTSYGDVCDECAGTSEIVVDIQRIQEEGKQS